MPGCYRMMLLGGLCVVLGLTQGAPAQTGRKRAAQTKKPTPTPTPPPSATGIVPRRVEQQPAPTPYPPGTPPKRYVLKGKIYALYPQLSLAEVEHEAIADYMEAMTMKFPLKDKRLFERLKVGDRITATLVVSQTGGEWWLEKVVKLK
ncbi:MAG: copper-binding protein [Acidobacteria bacterium]|nr:copper-binding protein [Acidobacteriota bacterium]MBI3425387.1 copper-binding protein [Acidobacteriota bacterium]